MTTSPRPTLWIALVAIAILAGGLWLALHQWRIGQTSPAAELQPPEPAPLDTSSVDTSGTMVTRALAQIPAVVDSAELKSRWREEVGGADLAGLSAAQRELVVRFANAERCTCGCGFTLAACRAYDLTCPVSLPRVKSLVDSVRSGLITSARGLRARPAEGVTPR
jgi:hypothetical protein